MFKKLEKITRTLIYDTMGKWFGKERLAQEIVDKGEFLAVFSEVQTLVQKAYNYGFADGLNTVSEPPFKCGECEETDLVFDGYCTWDYTTRNWAITRQMTNEAYCNYCEKRVKVYQRLMGDYNNA